MNVGCPSDRVQEGGIGACLMATPHLVADCFQAMNEATSLPVTIKSRIGIDDQDSYDDFHTFISTLYDAGCRDFIVHARKAVLKGLSPKKIEKSRAEIRLRVCIASPSRTPVLH